MGLTMQAKQDTTVKNPTYLSMLKNEQERLKTVIDILEAPDHILTEKEKQRKIDALALEYEVNVLEDKKWNNFVQVDCRAFPEIVKKIADNAPNSKRTLVIFNLLLASIDKSGKSSYTAQQLAKELNCHVNNIYPSLKWLRDNDIIQGHDCNKIHNINYQTSKKDYIFLSDWIVRKRRSIQHHLKQMKASIIKEDKRKSSIRESDLFYNSVNYNS